ncbi:unnamed protein product [Merluccius merluccius]
MNLSGIHAQVGPLLLPSNHSPPREDRTRGGRQWTLPDATDPDSDPFSADVLFSGHEPGTIALVLMYAASFAAGLGGNVTALLALTRKRNRRSGASATRRLLVNLAACDMLVVCVCMPVNLAHQVHHAWVFGDLLCRAVPFVQAVSVSASVLSLAVISLNRYYSVRSPLHARSLFTARRVLVLICGVWTASSGLCAPLLFANATRALLLQDAGGAQRSVTVCVEGWSRAGLRQGYNLLLFCCLYCFPVGFNLVLSCLTGRELWGTDRRLGGGSGGGGGAGDGFGGAQVLSRVRVRKRIAKMVLALVLLFTVSWLPLYAVDIWIDLNMPDSLDLDPDLGEEDGGDHARHGWILQGRPFAQWLGLTNSALNPLCYCFVGNLYRSAQRFRQSYREKLSSVFSLSVQQPSVRGSEGRAAPCARAHSEKDAAPAPGDGRRRVSKGCGGGGGGNNLAKSKSLSTVTVCETVFD